MHIYTFLKFELNDGELIITMSVTAHSRNTSEKGTFLACSVVVIYEGNQNVRAGAKTNCKKWSKVSIFIALSFPLKLII